MGKRKSNNGKVAKKKSTSPKKSVSRVVYKRNYLTQVLARLDFSATHNMLESGPPKSVVNVLKANFPIIEQKKQVHLGHFQLVSGDATKKPKDMLKDVQQSRRESFQVLSRACKNSCVS